MTNLYVLKNDQQMLGRMEKLEEEVKEVFDAMTEYAIWRKNKEHLAEECMDVIEVLLGIMDHAGINMEYAVKRHNEKLVGRGWKFKKPVFKLVDKNE